MTIQLVDDPSRQSQRSMSLSTVSVDVASDSALTSSIDLIFPLYDEITRVAPQKSGSSVIMFFIILFEAFLCGYFPFLPDTWDFDKSSDKILRYISYILDFGNADKSILNSFIPSIIIICLTFLIYLWFICLLAYYQANKTFNRKTIFISRFIFSYNVPVLLIPIMYSFGFNLNAIFTEEKNQTAYIVLTVLSAILVLNIYFVFYLDIIFRSSTPYLEKSCFSMWDGNPFFYFVLIQGFSAFSSRLLFHFPKWTRCFLVVVYCFASGGLIFATFYFPYVNQTSNIIMASMHTTNIISSILAICPILSVVRLIIPIIIFIISVIVYKYVFKYIRKKVVEEPKIKNELQSLRSLHVCISDDPNSFINWTLVRSITTRHQTTNILVRTAQILSFFPSESQLLNMYVALISKRSDLKLNERFLFYQIRRVHVLRQSSATKLFNYEFEEVKKSTSKMIACFSQFFISNNDLSIETLVGLVKLNRKTNSICLEAIDKYPNSARLMYEYSKYLIECHAQFKEGAAWHYKAELMDSGKHTVIDYSFRAMVNLFPVYLKKEILDYKGKKIIQTKKDQSNSSNSSMTGQKFDLDDEANEEEAEKIFDKPRLRFALKRAVDNMKCPPLSFLIVASFVRLFLTLLIFLLLFFCFYNFFDGRLDNTILMESVATIRETYLIGMTCLCQLIGSNFKVIGMIYYPEETTEYNIFQNPSLAMLSSTMDGLRALQDLSSMLSLHGSSIAETAKSFLVDGEIQYCFDNGTLLPPTPSSTWSMAYYLLSMLPRSAHALLFYGQNITKSSVLCELGGNAVAFQNNMDKATVDFTQRESATASKINKQLDIGFIVVPIALTILILVPLIIAMIMLSKYMKRVFSAIMMLPKEVLIQASKPIVKSEFDSTTVASSIELDRLPSIGIPFVVVLANIISVVAIVLLMHQIRTTNNRFMNAAYWLETSARRGPTVMEALSNAYLLAYFQVANYVKYGSALQSMQFLKQNLDTVMKLNRDLLVGNDEIPSCNGFSEELDEIHYGDSCTTEIEEIGLHGSYNCLSVDQLMMIFSTLIEELLAGFQENYTNLIGLTDNFLHLSHLVFYHLFPNLQRVKVILSDSCKDLITGANLYNGLLLIVAFILILILFAIERIFNLKLKAAINTLKILIARFPPNAVISNQNLLDLIIGKNQMKRDKQLSAAQSVIDSSPDAILALNGDCTIESMNPAACRIFGYTPEQILGQSLKALIPNPEEAKAANPRNQIANQDDDNSIEEINLEDIGESNEKDEQEKTGTTHKSTKNESTSNTSSNGKTESLYRQFALMKANQAAMTYSCQSVGLKDDDTEVNLEITLIGIKEGQYFALIAVDQTAKIRQQKEVEEAKKQSEKLLYQILPRDIVTRMNRGEKDISFTVPSATIIFIDVVKFSDYMATLTPKQIMQNVGKYFKNWDDLLQKYKTIIKIKLIGDVYMAAAGLFNPEMSPSIHASEMINFAIDGVRALEDINASLDANLSVRIGINTGGPIIAGVLGIDKPLFDIIGDPINISSRLQSTDIPNEIQISQATYDLVKDKSFDIEKRGEIFLKGKGNQLTYLVHPTQVEEPNDYFRSGSVFRLPRFPSTARLNPQVSNQSIAPSSIMVPEDDERTQNSIMIGSANNTQNTQVTQNTQNTQNSQNSQNSQSSLSIQNSQNTNNSSKIKT
ncbi:hypothetical protein M9Y10_033996 [Tritrichomonas musculus]|uniref:Adenylate and Guanylate cyclase catalytic domain containing protein n=1 Tax=Tritrichomonas musculus TaxID=1915356 RepID=A0ABR2KGU1_9EUKA